MNLTAFDLDGTLLTGNSSVLFCRYLHRQKVISLRQLLFCLRLYCQHLCFGLSLHTLHHRVFTALFRGQKVQTFAPHVETFLNAHLDSLLFPPVVARLKNANRVAILSSAPTFLVAPIAQRLGISLWLGTEYTIDKEGRLWDIAALIDGRAKADYIKQWKGKTKAYSDSHRDLPFLNAASCAVAVRPDRTLLRAARSNGWEILR